MYFKLTLVRLCTDLDKTIEWYSKYFDAKLLDHKSLDIDVNTISKIFSKEISDFEGLQIGNECLIYASCKGLQKEFQYPKPNSRHFQHIAIIVKNIDKIYKKLLEGDVHIVSEAPQTIPHTNLIAGGITVLYLYDNNGFPIALVEYPNDKGKEKWHQNSSVIKGIDHSAIVVSSLQTSTEWYEELGFYVDVEDIRQGVEQEKLTNLNNAKVTLTGLEGPTTYGIELIEYNHPKESKYVGTARQQALVIKNSEIEGKGLKHAPSGNLIYFT